MTSSANPLPYGVQIMQKASDRFPRLGRIVDRNNLYKYSVLILTFITYVAYHASRKPISVVKIVLYQNCSNSSVPPHVNNTLDPNWCSWEPFNEENHSALFGTLDSAFLFAYAIAMFFSGIIAERVNIRIFLTVGMILSGTACSMFGLARYYSIHSLWYFVAIQVFGGICQTTGWPGVVTAMGNWFGKGNRGLIFGIWNSHTSIGNIIGTLLASQFVEYNWGLSFIVPGLFIISIGILIYLFLVVHPSDINQDSQLNEKTQNGHKALGRNGVRRQSSRCDYSVPEENEILRGSSEEKNPSTYPQEVSIPLGNISAKELSLPSNKDEVKEKTEGSPILSSANGSPKKAIGFVGAIKIPGVLEFSMCLFFAKLVSYTFLYWLPNYIKNSSTYSPSQSADLSTLFDVGGIFGGIAAGIFSDMFGKSACTCAVMLFLAIPSLYAYNLFSSVSLFINIALLVIVGGLVNGPYALITTAVSAELGTHSSLKGNAKALSTVTSIIDGTGSIGAAVGPLVAAYVSDAFNWTSVFYILMGSNIFAILLLTRLVKREIQNTS